MAKRVDGGVFLQAWGGVVDESRSWLRAKGKAMAPTIRDGQFVAVDRGRRPENGDIVAAVLKGECAVARFYQFGRRVELKPDNRKFPTLVICPSDGLRILGVMSLE